MNCIIARNVGVWVCLVYSVLMSSYIYIPFHELCQSTAIGNNALALSIGNHICTTAALVFKHVRNVCELMIFPPMQGRYFLLMCRMLSFNAWLSIESQSVIAIAKESVKFILASVSLPTHYLTSAQTDRTNVLR